MITGRGVRRRTGDTPKKGGRNLSPHQISICCSVHQSGESFAFACVFGLRGFRRRSTTGAFADADVDPVTARVMFELGGLSVR